MTVRDFPSPSIWRLMMAFRFKGPRIALVVSLGHIVSGMASAPLPLAARIAGRSLFMRNRREGPLPISTRFFATNLFSVMIFPSITQRVRKAPASQEVSATLGCKLEAVNAMKLVSQNQGVMQIGRRRLRLCGRGSWLRQPKQHRIAHEFWGKPRHPHARVCYR